MPPRSPNSTFPLRTREALLNRHAKILELWQGRVPATCLKCEQPTLRRRTRQEVALAVGLRDASTMYRHINGKCRCLDGELAAGEIREVEAGAEDRGPAPLRSRVRRLQGAGEAGGLAEA
jgi:hypothetical protein